jgi:ParB family transcriptional regulator, chromosome partitioning protein
MAKELVIPYAVMIPVNRILIPNDFPNRSEGWEAGIKELMESIKSQGLIQPIVVRTLDADTEDGKQYRLVAGQRRLECVKRLEHSTVKAVALPAKTTRKEEFCARVSENFQRADYTPMEEAVLITYALTELQMSQQEFAAMIGMTPGWVSQRIAATKQPENVQKALEAGEITFTHVRELARVKDDDTKKTKLLEHAKKENAQEFKERVDTVLQDSPKAKNDPKKKKSGKTAEEALANGPGDNIERKARPRKEAVQMLGKLDKAYVAAQKNDDKVRSTQLAWFIKGVSWTYNLKGANPPKID